MVAPRTLPQRREYIAEPQLARVDQAREDLARILATCPFLRGRLVSVTLAATTSKTIRHSLGVAAAFIVIRQNYDSAHARPSLAESDQTGIDLTKSLSIIASTACTVDLWFYPRASREIDANQGQSL